MNIKQSVVFVCGSHCFRLYELAALTDVSQETLMLTVRQAAQHYIMYILPGKDGGALRHGLPDTYRGLKRCFLWSGTVSGRESRSAGIGTTNIHMHRAAHMHTRGAAAMPVLQSVTMLTS